MVIGLLLFLDLGLFAVQADAPALVSDGLPGDRMDVAGINCVSEVLIHDFLKSLDPVHARSTVSCGSRAFLVLALGVFASAMAFWAARFGQLIDACTQVVSIFIAPVLGPFLLVMLTKRATFPGGLVGAAVAIPAAQWLSTTPVHWAWRFPFSLAVTFAVGYAASLVLPRPPRQTTRLGS
jgi:hypothetical protein